MLYLPLTSSKVYRFRKNWLLNYTPGYLERDECSKFSNHFMTSYSIISFWDGVFFWQLSLWCLAVSVFGWIGRNSVYHAHHCCHWPHWEWPFCMFQNVFIFLIYFTIPYWVFWSKTDHETAINFSFVFILLYSYITWWSCLVHENYSLNWLWYFMKRNMKSILFKMRAVQVKWFNMLIITINHQFFTRKYSSLITFTQLLNTWNKTRCFYSKFLSCFFPHTTQNENIYSTHEIFILERKEIAGILCSQRIT